MNIRLQLSKTPLSQDWAVSWDKLAVQNKVIKNIFKVMITVGKKIRKITSHQCTSTYLESKFGMATCHGDLQKSWEN